MNRLAWLLVAAWFAAGVVSAANHRPASVVLSVTMLATVVWLATSEPERRPRPAPPWATDHRSYLCAHDRHGLCAGCGCVCHREVAA